MGKQGRPLELFDRLTKEEQKEGHSLWRGEKGTYVFEATGEIEAKRPVRKVYLNRTYLTGLFKSRNIGEYTGDIKEPEGKRYLVFRLLGKECMEVYIRPA